MKVVLWAVGGFLAGGLLTGVIGFSLPEVIAISQAEGAYAMGVAFCWVPAGAVVGGIAGSIKGALG